MYKRQGSDHSAGDSRRIKGAVYDRGEYSGNPVNVKQNYSDSEHDRKPVSYTHLDVYKRQVSASAGIAAAMLAKKNPLYLKYVNKTVQGLLANVTEDGRVTNVSGGTAVMKDREGYRLSLIHI